ncbi:MAG: alpha/beta hydrolase [Nevskia sp.]|nr:alpha/beta hydrolase [Nevskia sp.]
MKHTQGCFEGRNKTRIYWQQWIPEKIQAVVVIAHGLGEHSGRYEHVAKSLVDSGYAVYAMDHRGHGNSGGPRAFVDRFSNAVDDINAIVDIVEEEQRPRAKKRPIFLLGHSMGGALSLSYTIKFGERLSGLLLSGPAVALDGAPPLIGPISKVLSLIAPKLGLFPIDPRLVSRDPEMVAAYERDPLNAHGKVPARTLGEIVKFVEVLPALLPVIQLPLLVMHGGEDKLAGVAGSRMVMNRVSSQDKTLNVYDGLYHEIFNELPDARAQVIGDMTAWLKSRVS